VLAAGVADCEERDDWFFSQDVNAWTSLAYVAVGVAIALVVVRRRAPRSFIALGAVTALEGIGSMLYHGAKGDLAQLLHDVALVGVLGFVAGWHVGRLFDPPAERAGAGALVGLSSGLVVGSAMWAAAPGATNVAVVCLAAVLIGAELCARRRRLPPVWNAPLLVVAGVAAVAWVAGTPGSPLCDEHSWLQPHALWHVLTALVVFAWMGRAWAATADGVNPARITGTAW
jgi:hypothetical protein